jgi:hypothetical protein
MPAPPGVLGVDQQRAVDLDPIVIAQRVIERLQLTPYADLQSRHPEVDALRKQPAEAQGVCDP